MPTIKRIDHIGILVDDMDAMLNFWRDTLGIELKEIRNLPAEMAQVAFMPVADSEIELVSPTTNDSGLARFLEKRGPGMHHLCLETDDIVGMIVHLTERGIQMINLEPRTSVDGKTYAFVHPKSTGGVMVELYELPR